MIRSLSTASAVFVACGLTAFSSMAQQAAGTAAVGVQGNAAVGTQTAPTAQADPNAAAAANAQAPAPANQQAQMGMALPTATAAAPVAGTSDHDAVVGHIAVGFLGRASIPIYGNPALPVPVVGVRYWIDPMVGLDLGLGLWLGGTSTDTTVTPPGAAGATVTVSGPKTSAFVLHAGVPLALASAKHFTFEIIPEANFGYGQLTQDAVLTPGVGITKQSGTHFDVGARAGAEIHFGFMGLPQLSLLGTVGLRFDYDKLGQDATPAAPAGSPTTHIGASDWNLRTSVYDSPWNIFITNVGALYYF